MVLISRHVFLISRCLILISRHGVFANIRGTISAVGGAIEESLEYDLKHVGDLFGADPVGFGLAGIGFDDLTARRHGVGAGFGSDFDGVG